MSGSTDAYANCVPKSCVSNRCAKSSSLAAPASATPSITFSRCQHYPN